MDPLFESTEEGLRLRAPWRLLIQLTLFLVSLYFLSNSLKAGWSIIEPGTGNPTSVAATAESPAASLISALSYLGAALLSVWVAGRFLDRRPFKDFGFHLGAGWFVDLFFGVVLGGLLMTGIFLVELGLGWVSVTGTFQPLKTGGPFLVGLLVPVCRFVCVGIEEELVYRGYWLRNLAESLNLPYIGARGAVLLAWGLSSIYFGLVHIQSPGVTPLSIFIIMFAGLMLGLGYALTGELAIPIGLHFAWNFFESNVFGLTAYSTGPKFIATKTGDSTLWTGGNFGPEAGLLGVAAILFGCLSVTLWVRLRHGKVSVHTSIAEPQKPLLPNGSGPDQTSN